LINQCNEESSVIGTLASDDPALKDELMEFFKDLYTTEGMQVIEHILLRKRSLGEAFLLVQVNDDPEDCQCPEVMDPYSFRISVILPSWSERFQHIRFRQFVEKTIRMETPAHVYPRICWVNHCEMQQLEELYNSWLLKHSKVALQFKGCLPLPEITAEDLTENEKEMLNDYQVAQKNLIAKLYKLNNVFPTARLHDCAEVDGDNPQITLNETNLGTL